MTDESQLTVAHNKTIAILSSEFSRKTFRNYLQILITLLNVSPV